MDDDMLQTGILVHMENGEKFGENYMDVIS